MNSIAHIDDDKRVLDKDVYWLDYLGIILSGSNEIGMLVQNGSKSSLVANVKAKQVMNPTLVELTKLIVYKKIEIFSQSEIEY